jgi:hypothetical protein
MTCGRPGEGSQAKLRETPSLGSQGQIDIGTKAGHFTLKRCKRTACSSPISTASRSRCTGYHYGDYAFVFLPSAVALFRSELFHYATPAWPLHFNNQYGNGK